MKFKLTVNDVDLSTEDEYALTLTNTSGTTWTGGFASADMTVGALGTALAGRSIQVAPGALGANSPAQSILVNQDVSEVMLVLCAPNTAVYTVNYVVNGSTITWDLPAGMAMPTPNVNLTGNQSIAWYTDAEFTTAVAADATVSGDTTLYANITGSAPDPDPNPDPNPDEDDFYTALTTGQTATIADLNDWNTFVEYADEAVAGQLIKLGDDINCGGAVYDSLTLAGNFDGCGNTISNATFRAVNSGYYNSTESDIVCSGMFARLGAGQTVANLTLDNITAQYASTYSAPLAGLADGTSSQRVLILNVQVRNSSANGRTAAGVVGFIRNTTVRYCSSRDTTITGLANGGGVVGINNAHVEYCYSTSTPTALTFLGGSVGGVISKNVRGGNNNYCWAYMQVVGAEEDGPGQNLNSLEANASMSYETFYNNGFTQYCWTMSDNGPAEFDPDEVSYNFGSNS